MKRNNKKKSDWECLGRLSHRNLEDFVDEEILVKDIGPIELRIVYLDEEDSYAWKAEIYAISTGSAKTLKAAKAKAEAAAKQMGKQIGI